MVPWCWGISKFAVVDFHADFPYIRFHISDFPSSQASCSVLQRVKSSSSSLFLSSCLSLAVDPFFCCLWSPIWYAKFSLKVPVESTTSKCFKNLGKEYASLWPNIFRIHQTYIYHFRPASMFWIVCDNSYPMTLYIYIINVSQHEWSLSFQLAYFHTFNYFNISTINLGYS